MTTKRWPEDRRELVRKHFWDRLTAAESGRLLGVSKSTIIGQRDRMGLKVADRDAPAAKATHTPSLRRFSWEMRV